MESNFNLIYKLETNNEYDNYELCVNNLDYLMYRKSFNKYLNKFIECCLRYDIKFFYKKNNMYCILRENDVIDQINNTIKKFICDQLKILMEMDNYNLVNYVSVNKHFIDFNSIQIKKINKLIGLTNLVYKYNLLKMNYINIDNIDYNKEYNNLVNLSVLQLNKKSTKKKNCITIIDSYSW
jgi:hypothetical protein